MTKPTSKLLKVFFVVWALAFIALGLLIMIASIKEAITIIYM
jgi:hypothetical protein